MINCLPATSQKPNERSILNPEVRARCRQAVTSLGRSLINYEDPTPGHPITAFFRVRAIAPYYPNLG